MSKNDITGDSLRSRVATEAYRNAFDHVFKKQTRSIYVWGDGTWCEMEDLMSMTHMLDDYLVIKVPEGADYEEVEARVKKELHVS